MIMTDSWGLQPWLTSSITTNTEIPWPFPALGLFPDISLTSAEFPDISSFPEIPEKWQSWINND